MLDSGGQERRQHLPAFGDHGHLQLACHDTGLLARDVWNIHLLLVAVYRDAGRCGGHSAVYGLCGCLSVDPDV